MKNLFLLSFVLLSLSFIQCTSDDSDSDTESIHYKYENNNITINSWSAIKNGDRFVIIAAGDDQSFAIEFNKYGDLASANSYSNTTEGIPFSKSFIYYSSYFLNFDLINIDTDNMMVKFSFNGVLHEDDSDIDSVTHSVEGDFNIKYTEVTETEISKVYCKIDGQNWYATTADETGVGNLEISNHSDDQYTVSIFFNTSNTPLCSNQSFNTLSNLKMGLSTYNPITDDFTYYDVTGTISVTEFTPPSGLSYGRIQGTYDFTAVHPVTGNSISVTNGTFKKYFLY